MERRGVGERPREVERGDMERCGVRERERDRSEGDLRPGDWARCGLCPRRSECVRDLERERDRDRESAMMVC